ncbi:MAG: spore coat protein CotJB [Tissierellaceae bacterium]|nr:spore coat protein CotJB [Tissierellaceae bacterium]
MDRAQMRLLVDIMEANFVVVETALYLDTHPNDEGALRLHNSSSQRYQQLLDMYESRYSPLRNTSTSRYPWGYVEEPWPWDINFTNI